MLAQPAPHRHFQSCCEPSDKYKGLMTLAQRRANRHDGMGHQCFATGAQHATLERDLSGLQGN